MELTEEACDGCIDETDAFRDGYPGGGSVIACNHHTENHANYR